MATLDHGDPGLVIPERPAINLPRLRWTQIVAISIFYFALTFHWTALGVIILPDQVLKIVGEAHKGEALAAVLVPGAFVSLFANPLFGLLSDRTRGWLATWGRRRPYILAGTLVNIAGLTWMALARDIPSLTIAYIIVQFSSNAAQAPFHALLPDVVPVEQRGRASGIMGLLQLLGTIAGTIVAGLLIDTSKPLPAFTLGLWLTYGIIGAVMIALMLVTLFSIHEDRGTFAQSTKQAAPLAVSRRRFWLTRATVLNVAGTLIVTVLVWVMMLSWNYFNLAGVQIGDAVQQVVLEVIATIGLLRLFDFNPRRDPDFAWVLFTRLLMMLGIYTIQAFFLFYMRDAVKAPHPEAATSTFTIIVALTSLVSAVVVGWLSDHYGRKRMVYISGGFMALVGLVFIITQSLPLVLAAGAIFGLGYGAYQSVDWALVADVLPSYKNYARDMGIWNVSLSLSQVIAPILGGPLIDLFAARHQPVLGFQVIFGMAIVFCLAGTVTVRYIKSVKS